MSPAEVKSPEPVLDFDKLLRPISADRPTGTDLRTDPSSPFEAIREERTRWNKAETSPPKKEDDKPPPAPPDWRPVKEKCILVLAEQTKDLDVVAYLIEALVRVDGYAGLRDGFRLARELVERFWDGLYPVPAPEPAGEGPPGDDKAREEQQRAWRQNVAAKRVNILGQLDSGQRGDGPLIRAIKSVPITEPTSCAVLTCLYYPDAVDLEKVTDPAARARRLKDGVTPLETYRKAVGESSEPFYKALVRDLDLCLAEFEKLCAALAHEKRCGRDAPPSSKTRAALQFCKAVVTDLAKNKLAAAAPAAAPAAAKANGAAAPPPQHNGAPGPIASRDEAFRRLAEVNEFFRRAEPLSFVIPVLDQVLRWEKLSMAEVLTELIPEDAPRKALFKQLGMRPEPAAADKGKK